jgi:hypothetical protein
MQIQLDPHTIERAKERGASEEQIIETLTSGRPIIAEGKRFGKVKTFDFHNLWKGKYYDEKQLIVYYITEGETITTITVYVYYGKF